MSDLLLVGVAPTSDEGKDSFYTALIGGMTSLKYLFFYYQTPTLKTK